MNGWTVQVEYMDGCVATFSPCAYPNVSENGVLRLNVGWAHPLEHVGIPLVNIRRWTATQDCVPLEGAATDCDPMSNAISDQRLIAAFVRGLQ